jgi:hypothetical protein
MGCCEAKGDSLPGNEPEINAFRVDSSFTELNISSDDFRASTNPNELLSAHSATFLTPRPRSTSYHSSTHLELAFLVHSPLFTKTSEFAKSVLIPFSENSLELGVIKEEEKDITVSFEDVKGSK